MKRSRRAFTLLEVLIAFALVVLCVFPLLATHAYITRAQQQYIAKIELDRIAGNVYGDILQRLYNADLRWADIVEGTEFAVDQSLVERLPYEGIYRFNPKPEYEKKNEQTGRTLFLLELTLSFSSQRALKTIDYRYWVLIDYRSLSQVFLEGEEIES